MARSEEEPEGRNAAFRPPAEQYFKAGGEQQAEAEPQGHRRRREERSPPASSRGCPAWAQQPGGSVSKQRWKLSRDGLQLRERQ